MVARYVVIEALSTIGRKSSPLIFVVMSCNPLIGTLNVVINYGPTVTISLKLDMLNLQVLVGSMLMVTPEDAVINT